jgi:hypothetical protein
MDFSEPECVESPLNTQPKADRRGLDAGRIVGRQFATRWKWYVHCFRENCV